MLRKVQYSTETEYNQLIVDSEALGERLISVENITEGNFLTFTDDMGDSEQIAILTEELQLVKVSVDDLILNGGGI